MVEDDIDEAMLISRIDFKGTTATVFSDSKPIEFAFPNEAIVLNIKQQVTNLASSMSIKPTIGWLLDTVVVKQGKSDGEVFLHTRYSIENTGKITIVPKAS